MKEKLIQVAALVGSILLFWNACSSAAFAEESCGQALILNSPLSGSPDVAVTVSMVLNSGAAMVPTVVPEVSSAGDVATSVVTYAELENVSQGGLSFDILDANNTSHTLHLIFFRLADVQWQVRAYVDSADVDFAGTGRSSRLPRSIGSTLLDFSSLGLRTHTLAAPDLSATIGWNNSAAPTHLSVNLSPLFLLPGVSSLCRLDLDYCPADSQKDSPQLCGCGRSDGDFNANFIPDCKDPTRALKPLKPKATSRRGKLQLHLQSIPGKNYYIVEMTQGRRVRVATYEWSDLLISKVSKGLVRIRYKVQIGSGAASTTTQSSDSITIRIRK